jgi:hypothetical protein
MCGEDITIAGIATTAFKKIDAGQFVIPKTGRSFWYYRIATVVACSAGFSTGAAWVLLILAGRALQL